MKILIAAFCIMFALFSKINFPLLKHLRMIQFMVIAINLNATMRINDASFYKLVFVYHNSGERIDDYHIYNRFLIYYPNLNGETN